MRAIITSVLLSSLLYSCADAPEETPDAIEEVSDESTQESKILDVHELVPEGYTLFKTFKGDLNKDEYEDMVLVMNAIDTNDEMLNRGVMLVTTDKDGNMSRVAFNKAAAYCPDCGGAMGDPFVDVVIKDGYFTIEHMGGSREMWTDDPTFKYSADKNAWFLHRRSKQVVDRLDPEGEGSSQTMLTTKDFGEVRFEDFMY